MDSLNRTDLKACHARLRDGSRTFRAASFLLPRRVRDPAAALYAFCRIADDAIDQGTDCDRALADLRDRLERIYSAKPAPFPEDRAFACVVNHFGIPRALPEAMFEGFEWDSGQRRYDEINDLHAYSARVAGTVGAMMAVIMGVRSPAIVARACELGMAMQLTNIARDVGEDARAGRLYLPRRWLQEAGIDPENWLRSPGHDAALAGVIGRLLRTADQLYENADTGIGCLPSDCRGGIGSARLVYTEIGRELERRGLDAVTGRAVVSTARKLRLIRQSMKADYRQTDFSQLPVIESARFLVEAVIDSPAPAASADFILPAAWWEFNKRWAWAVDLFDQLERRERSRVA